MKNVAKFSLLLTIFSIALLGAYAEHPAPNNQPQQVDLNGEWEIDSSPDSGLRLLITQAGTGVKTIFIHENESGSYKNDCAFGGQRDHLFEGQLQGTDLSGKMMRCLWKQKKLIDDCHLDPVWETTFKATVTRNEVINGTWFAEGWGFQTKAGHLINCHRDDKYNANHDFKLYRACYFSGLDWVSRYPDSTSTNDLAAPFRTNVNNFIAALQAAGATVGHISTYRPVQRSYLMHYAWEIAHGTDPRNVPSYALFICWVHRDANGNIDLPASRTAAQQMIGPTANGGYGMAHDAAWDDQWFDPSHDTRYSRHNLSNGIDMTITWPGNLTITDGNGRQVTIASTPRNGNDNTALHAVGATYGVLKLPTDPPHWSNTGH